MGIAVPWTKPSHAVTANTGVEDLHFFVSAFVASCYAIKKTRLITMAFRLHVLLSSAVPVSRRG